jgi:PAS domain S-box-containing protein
VGFTIKLLIPALAAALLLAVAALLTLMHIAVPAWAWLFAGAAVLISGWLSAEWLLRRPLLRLAGRVHRLLGDVSYRSAVPAPQRSALGVLEQAIAELEQVQSGAATQLEREQTLRRHSENVLRELEERHALALRCVNDGLWEWDLKTNAMYYAPTWKSALGFGEHEVGDGLHEWHDRIHPDDRATVLRKLDEHVQGATAMFECDQRLLHRDGRYRWFLTRGRAVRSAGGTPYKVIGLNTDIGARKRAEEILTGIARGLTCATGADFFKLIVKNFAEVLGVHYAFITECIDHPRARVRMLASWCNGAYSDNLEYDLPGTPCEITIRQGQINLIEDGLENLYPAEAGYRSYLGIPICDAAGKVIGHLACLGVQPLQEDLPLLPIFTLFALRAGVEMEHQLLLRTLERERSTVPG